METHNVISTGNCLFVPKPTHVGLEADDYSACTEAKTRQIPETVIKDY